MQVPTGEASAWALYDALVRVIPADVLVRDVVMGVHHCLVEAECATGLAATCHGGTHERLSDDWRGRPLRDLAALARSWDFEVASVGVAALNAWHNRAELLDDLGPGIVGPSDDVLARALEDGGDPFVFLPPVLRAWGREGRLPRVSMVGHFPRASELARVSELSVLERARRDGSDLPDTACEYVIPGSDLTLVTGMTLENKTAPRLLELARESVCVVAGPTTTLSPALLSGGADLLAGSCVVDPERARLLVQTGVFPRGTAALAPALVANERGHALLAQADVA